MNEWWRVARSPGVVRRALRVAMVVGSVLVLINHGDHLLTGHLATKDLYKILLTYCVPYCVSTYSATSALMARR